MIDRRHAHGFTLLEILLVLVLLSLTAIVVVPTFPKKNNDDAKTEAERFYQLIQLWNEKSLITSQVMGVRIEENNYRLMQLDGNNWKIIAKQGRVATEVEMPEDITLSVEIAGMTSNEDQLFSREDLFEDIDFNEEEQEIPDPPQLVMMGNGELIAFTLVFASNNQDLWKVTGSDIGVFELIPFNEDRE